jgi:hypothetical protein
MARGGINGGGGDVSEGEWVAWMEEGEVGGGRVVGRGRWRGGMMDHPNNIIGEKTLAGWRSTPA